MHVHHAGHSGAFLSKFALGGLGRESVSHLAALPWRRLEIARGEEIPTRGNVSLVGSGWLARHRGGDTEAQMVGLHLPGDFCSFDFLTGPTSGTTLSALVPAVTWTVPLKTFLEVAELHPEIISAALALLAAERAICEEHLISLGSRNALVRMAHLICELRWRLAAAGFDVEKGIDFPLSQPRLADYLSLSSVHVNRTLQALRRPGLIDLRDRHLMIRHQAELERIGGFSSTYLVPGSGDAAAPASPAPQAGPGDALRHPAAPPVC